MLSNKLNQNKTENDLNLQLNLFAVLWHIPSDDGNIWNDLLAKLKEFFGLWPLQQWVSSILGLILLYIVTGHIYNKWLSKTMRGHWLSFKARLGLIIFDLVLNVWLGVYYLEYRETIMGQIMRKCPIAISPAIFALELFCVTGYYFYYYYLPFSPRWIHFKKKMDENPVWSFLVKNKNQLLALFKRAKGPKN